MERKNPTEIKELIVKWQRPGQRALVTPFRNAKELEGHPLQLIATVSCQEKEQYDLRKLYTQKKGNNINTVDLLFKH